MVKKKAKVVETKKVEATKEVTTNVVEFNDVVLMQVRANRKDVGTALKDFRKELKTNVEDIQRLYNEDYQGCKAKIDYLCNVSGCNVSDFFDVDFVKTLYKTYTFDLSDNSGIRTLIAEEKNVTEKTDFVKLAEKCEKCPFIGVSLDIKGAKFETKKADGTKSGKFKYWMPILNFSSYNIINHLLTLDAYTLGVAAYKKAVKAEKAKAKKLAKKAAKAANKVDNTTKVEDNKESK